ncbi:unnamed protein product [Lampetra planeri]
MASPRLSWRTEGVNWAPHGPPRPSGRDPGGGGDPVASLEDRRQLMGRPHGGPQEDARSPAALMEHHRKSLGLIRLLECCRRPLGHPCPPLKIVKRPLWLPQSTWRVGGCD